MAGGKRPPLTTEQLNQLINLLASITLLEMMVAIGLGVSIGDLLPVATDWRLVTKAVLASYACVPAAAVGLLILFHAEPFVAAGFLVAAVCPGAPYSPPFTGLAKGNVAVSVGLMVILAGSSALLAPLLLQLLVPFALQFLPPLRTDGPALAIDGSKVVLTLLVAQFLPLCVGLAVRQWRPNLADRLKRPANLLSMVLNLTMLGLILFAQFDMLIGIPLRAYAGMLVLVLAGVAAGWLLSGSGTRSRHGDGDLGSAMLGSAWSLSPEHSRAIPERVVAATAFALFQTIVMALIAPGPGAGWFNPASRRFVPEKF